MGSGLLLIHLPSVKIHIPGLSKAETLVICRHNVIIEHQEVRVLSGLGGSLACFNSKLPGAVDGISQDHFLNEAVVDTFMELVALGNAGVKDSRNAVIDSEIDSAQESRVKLLIA